MRRSDTYIRARAPFLWAALVLVLAAGAASAGETMGMGDFDFYLDTAAFRGREGRDVAEVDIRIPNNEIKFNENGGRWEGHVKLSVQISALDGTPVVQDAAEMHFEETTEARATNSVYFQTVIKRYHLEPGVYRLSYAIEDLQSPKITMVGMMKDENKISIVRDHRLELPEFPDDLPSFSDAKFVWSVEGDDGHGRREYHPNPPRLYGLYKDSLMVYLELYLPESMADAPSFGFQSIIVDAGSNEVKATNIRLPDPGPGVGSAGGNGIRTYPILLREDLNELVAGVYTLRVAFYLDNRLVGRTEAGSFSVAWDLRTWEVPRREIMAEARFLLGDDAFDRFREATAGDQEKMLDAMWKKADPTPETAENEAYDTFLARLTYVSSHYADYGPGVFDPRGQLYLRLGPPDEIIQDVVPLNRETVAEAVQMIEDKYHAVSFSTHGVKQYSTATKSHIVDPRGLADQRAGDNVAYPFELWVYHNDGDPIFPRDRVQEMDIGMRYLFIDREGYGRYKLESSSSISTK